MCQAELEAAKCTGITKLQQSSEALQNEMDETNGPLSKEREKAFEGDSSIINRSLAPVEDTEKIQALTSEVETLKVTLLKLDDIPSYCLLV